MDDQTPQAPRPRQLSQSELRMRFPLDFTIDPETREVTVPTAWRRANLVKIEVIPGRNATVHRAAAPVFQEWLRRAAALDVLQCIVTVDGGFNPRLKRGRTVPATEAGLSRHARGTAIDLNARFNPMGKPAAAYGEPGCLLLLVQIAYELDIVWGGDWRGSSCDPMHFEIGAQR